MEETKILIVDDERALVELLTDIFATKFKVFVSFDGDTALKILREENIGLIISDVLMPGIDGLELCAMIKTTVELSHIPVVLLTAKSDLEDKIAGLQNGADVYIEKPFSPAYLEAQVLSLLQNRFRLREHFARQPFVGITSLAFTKTDERFLTALQELIEEHIADPFLDIEYLAARLHMSRTTLYRKINELSDLTPAEIIDLARLNKAAALIREGQYQMSEIAMMTGYSSPSQFSKNFKRRFGKTPLAYSRGY
ncbi:response regulator transcription factor [Niabella drilacis]|uniref:Two component transcriptional regulator, AraC family n=1 Tax=Niabella drilacis (strain DSM 25811 / CCM 8410 / CCUG 62505 / LMG 26954 / E90) TaxID=1285928 RepID=A0A1G6PXG6_NIADE|nr:response regulator [Niabella drilacis]SDC84354.1 two component transcriptional regulator, AraC family [Niabella drilacis]